MGKRGFLPILFSTSFEKIGGIFIHQKVNNLKMWFVRSAKLGNNFKTIVLSIGNFTK